MKYKSLYKKYIDLGMHPRKVSILILVFMFFSRTSLLAIVRDSGIPENLVIAVDFFHEGQYKQALKAFESVIRRDPNSPEAIEALYYIAECSYALENWIGAIENYKKFQKRSVKNQIERLIPHFAESLVNVGNLSEAIQLYQEWIDKYYDTFQAREIQGRIGALKHQLAKNMMTEGQYREAKYILEDLLQKNYNTVERLILQKDLADCLFYLELWTEAMDIYEEVQKAEIEVLLREQIMYQIIRIRFARRNWNEALEEVDRFLTSYPNSSNRFQVVNLKAWSLYHSGQYKKAVEFLFSQSEIKPVLDLQNISPWIIAEEAKLGWDYKKAITMYESIINETTHDSKGKIFWLAHLELAECLWKLWKFQGAQKIYHEISVGQVNKDLKVKAKIKESETYYNQGWYSKAYETLSSILEEDQGISNNDKVLFLAAQSLCELRRWEEAKDLFQSLTNQYPDSPYLKEVEWKIAQVHFKLCHFQKAVELLNAFIQKYPESQWLGEAIYMIGWAHIYLEALDNAEVAFKKLLQNNSEEDLISMSLFSLGQIDFQKGEYNRAHDLFLKSLSKAKDKDLIKKANFFIALSHLQIGRFKPARKGFEKILNDISDDKNKDALTLLGWAWQAEGKYRNANSIFKRLLEVCSDYEMGMALAWRLAKNSYLLGDYQGTLHWIDLILCEADQIPYQRPARVLQLQCFLDQKDYKGYLEMWDPFLDHNPGVDFTSASNLSKANELIKKGEFRNAAKLYKDLSIEYANSPKEIEALLGLGMAQKAQGFYKTALRTFVHAMNRCSKDEDDEYKVRINLAMGEILFKEKAYGFAERHFEKTISVLAPEDLRARAVFFLGIIQHIQGRKKVAIKRFKELFESDTLGYISINEKIELGLFLEDESEYALAVEIFQKVLESQTDEKMKAEAQFWIGQCYQEMGDLEKAVHAYLQVSRLYPNAHMWGITAQFKSAEIHQKLGNLKKALALYKNVEKEGKGESYGQFAAKRIGEIKELIEKKKKGGMR